MDRTTRPLVIFAAFAGSLLVGLVIMLWALGGLRTVTAPAAIGGPFQLTDQAGQTVTDKDVKGRPTLIFFGFTHCPDICPAELQVVAQALEQLGDKALLPIDNGGGAGRFGLLSDLGPHFVEVAEVRDDVFLRTACRGGADDHSAGKPCLLAEFADDAP